MEVSLYLTNISKNHFKTILNHFLKVQETLGSLQHEAPATLTCHPASASNDKDKSPKYRYPIKHAKSS